MDNAGAPGTSQALGSDSTVQRINTGTQNAGTDGYGFLVNLGDIPLGNGAYIFWDTTSSAPAGAASARFTSELNGLFGYSSSGSKLAFQLLDTPACNAVTMPSTCPLLLSPSLPHQQLE